MTTTTTNIMENSVKTKPVKEFNESVLKQILHVDEIVAAIYFLATKPIKSNMQKPSLGQSYNTDDLAFNDYILGSVARPYAVAIRQLPENAMVMVTILHHALRALDTIEDDMVAFENNEIKISHLENFVSTALEDPSWSMHGVGEGDEALLLEQFPKCHSIYKDLSPAAQEIIKDITHRMAVGMSETITLFNFQGPEDIEQYDRYCHWVAGLVGEGLIRVFALAGLESPSFGREVVLADKIGFFLQKVNIIRDFLEDYHEKRVFWPKEIWGKYSKTGQLTYFADLGDEQTEDDLEASERALQCLNEMVTNALEEVPHVLAFLGKMRCMETYRFFALLQLGAIATLRQCYNNPLVFKGKVRIRKGLACQLALAGHQPDAVHEAFFTFAESIKQEAEEDRSRGINDPSHAQTVEVCEKIMEITKPGKLRRQTGRLLRWCFMACLGVCLMLYSYFHQHNWSVFSANEMQLDPLLAIISLVVLTALAFYVAWPMDNGPQQLQLASTIQKSTVQNEYKKAK